MIERNDDDDDLDYDCDGDYFDEFAHVACEYCIGDHDWNEDDFDYDDDCRYMMMLLTKRAIKRRRTTR
ncbi:hypothetical protein DPMN_045382 [Dreissena polymorpha]|uniref:Uncharacterized protein n=1 Tax=Dreissena polymorpha TaxID=45954 RepID=A0A9D4D645_DREPO|nr:hypothetical protein DPMN_045382 [Dreissena polymorpha]